MPAEPTPRPERDRLLAEVRRRAARRRRNRRLGWAGGGGAAVVALAVAVALTVPSGAPTSTRVVAPVLSAPSTVPGAPSTVPTSPGTTPPVSAATTPATTAVPAATTGGSSAVSVPLVVCPTQDAAYGATPPSLPATVQVTAAPAMASGLAVYTDRLGLVRVVAPRAWACSAIDAGDGSAGVGAHPPGQPLPTHPSWSADQWHLSAGARAEAVVGTETAACQGCANGQACPLFAAAVTAYQQQFGRPCPATRPAAERVERLSGAVVAFEDPPGVAGDASPSGGADPANAVMTYRPGTAQGTWFETCTLPSAQAPTCTVSLDAFLGAYGSR